MDLNVGAQAPRDPNGMPSNGDQVKRELISQERVQQGPGSLEVCTTVSGPGADRNVREGLDSIARRSTSDGENVKQTRWMCSPGWQSRVERERRWKVESFCR